MTDETISHKLAETRGDYVPPYCTPKECDHENSLARKLKGCSHCCPCDECGRIRADNADS